MGALVVGRQRGERLAHCQVTPRETAQLDRLGVMLRCGRRIAEQAACVRKLAVQVRRPDAAVGVAQGGSEGGGRVRHPAFGEGRLGAHEARLLRQLLARRAHRERGGVHVCSLCPPLFHSQQPCRRVQRVGDGPAIRSSIRCTLLGTCALHCAPIQRLGAPTIRIEVAMPVDQVAVRRARRERTHAVEYAAGAGDIARPHECERVGM
mmetsp:Transcript_22900/g.74119  ORF Transcript_22900/g.74119 Transcript_22900/m.74119 type:complete len:207 (+) Transcript_22900:2240-2860(+)|eukprot:scaffold978_cov118-Isochrysis_galbana.AAC.7